MMPDAQQVLLVVIVVCTIGVVLLVGWAIYATSKPLTLDRGTSVRDTDQGKLYAMIADGKCPDCGHSDGFYEGPRGGMSTNVFCANRECRAGFNVTSIVGIAERIHQGDLERYPKTEAST